MKSCGRMPLSHSAFIILHSAFPPMSRRLAAATSLVAFALCLMAGIAAENTLSTTLSRALVAMVGTLVVGLVVGSMGQRMLEENVKTVKAKLAAEEQQRKESEAAQKQEAAQK